LPLVLLSLYFLVRYLYVDERKKYFDKNIILSLGFLFLGVLMWNYAVYFVIAFLFISQYHRLYILANLFLIPFLFKLIISIRPNFLISHYRLGFFNTDPRGQLSPMMRNTSSPQYTRFNVSSTLYVPLSSVFDRTPPNQPHMVHRTTSLKRRLIAGSRYMHVGLYSRYCTRTHACMAMAMHLQIVVHADVCTCMGVCPTSAGFRRAIQEFYCCHM
jgi:hypothetical protein